MNSKEIGEIRRRQRRDRSNMTTIYGCYVGENKEIISEFQRSLATMTENEAEKYFTLLRRILGGTQNATLGKNLLDITFRTAQVADSPEHKMLMGLRGDGISDDVNRSAFFKKVIASVSMESNYLILLGTETYDVPFKNKNGEVQAEDSVESYTYTICAICPVKQTKPVLHYEPESKEFQDGNMVNAASAPALGFIFPAFDDRATNIYNALFFTRSASEAHEEFITEVFNTPVARPAEEQKEAFDEMLTSALQNECSMEVVQMLHEQIGQQIALHKESKCPESLTLTVSELANILKGSGVSETAIETFTKNCEATFGTDAALYPDNIVNCRKMEVKTPDVSIKVSPDRCDLIQTRVIGGIKYILIQADDSVEVNGISIHIDADQDAK